MSKVLLDIIVVNEGKEKITIYRTSSRDQGKNWTSSTSSATTTIKRKADYEKSLSATEEP